MRFECKMNSILKCHCSQVELNQEQTEFMREQWDGCLCKDCLKELSQLKTMAIPARE